MARKNKGFTKTPVADAVETVLAPETPAEAVTPEPVVTQQPTRKRLPLEQARAHNKVHVKLAADAAVTAADVALTSKGTNPRKTRVYGYDNLAEGGGRVPKGATLAIVPGAELPKGVQDGQWTKLKGYAGQTVEAAYGNGVSSRTVRRAYRAGAIRFVNAAPTTAQPEQAAE